MPIPAPPPVLSNARVLEFAILDDSVIYSGHSLLYVGEKEIGPVPCLAICQELDRNDILLLHSDKHWNGLGAAVYPTIEAAKAKAEQIYSGVSERWKPSVFTEAEARDYWTQMWAGQKCSFCGRIPPQIDRMVEKNGVRICDLCIGEFQKELNR